MPDRLRRLCAAALLLTLAAAPARAGTPKVPPPAHPVVSAFERFFHDPKSDLVHGGRLLLGELNCTSCHKTDSAQDAHLAKRQAPVLDGVGGRVRRDYLRKYLGDPHAAKPGTTMPHALAHVPDAERKDRVEELLHYLAATAAPKQERPEPKLIGQGRDLFHKVGCVACHGTRDNSGDAQQAIPSTVPLGDVKAKYTLAGLSAFLADPNHVRADGRMPGLLDAKEAKAVANYLLQGVTLPAGALNMNYAYYEGSWDKLPDLDKLKPKAKGKAAAFDLGVTRRPSNFALRFDGYLQIESAGDYTFHLSSDDGSKLWIDGKLLVDNDGTHATTTKSGKALLTKGAHKIVVAFFNAGGPFDLNVEFEGRNLGRQQVGSFVTLTPDAKPKEVAKQPKGGDEAFTVDPQFAAKGRAVFSTMGCASCHQLKSGPAVVKSELVAPALAKLKPEGGCLTAEAGKKVPQYRLGERQRKALSAAITALAAPKARPATREVIAHTFTAMNCYACHQRDKKGGPEEPWNAHFKTPTPEMGDEGRIPPPLDGVGAKMNPGYLESVMANGSKDRAGYMHTRMPKFGKANTAHLVKAFAEADTLKPVADVKFDETPGRVKAAGRHMVGGNTLGCIKCHTFNGAKAEGIQGIDMALLTQRVQRGWFHQYLIDPSKFRPGTRMPTSWPNGETFLKDLLGGSTPKQVEAIWVYLKDGKSAQVPFGVGKVFIPLIPDKEAILYRNFIAGAGPRAIGVGYPEKAHLAFDANDMRLALIWQGDFIDASKHWTDRGSGYQGPLGDNVLKMPPGPTFAVLPKDDAPWPTKPAKELGYRFRGYRLTDDQRPTFLYALGEIGVEDFPNAVAVKGQTPALRRTLTLTAPKGTDNLYYRAALGDKIEALGGGRYRVNGEWTIRVASDDPPLLRTSAGKRELLVPVRFEPGRPRVVGVEIHW